MSAALIYVLAGFLAGTFAGTWKPFLGFHKAPPTQEVTQLQAQVTTAQQAAAKAEKDKDTAIEANKAALSAQVRAAQTDNVGTVEAIKKAPPSPEVSLALRMAQRVDLKLAVAIGKLPEADQQAMVELIEQALSGKQAEVDAANAKLAKADADFRAITAQRDQIAAQIPVLTQRAVEAAKQAETVQAAYNGKVNEVNDWAAKKAEADKRAGSFFGAFSSMRHWAMGIGAVALVLFLYSTYLHLGQRSVGSALHELQPVLGAENYQKVVSTLDTNLDKYHQWIVSGGRKAATALAAKLTPHP